MDFYAYFWGVIKYLLPAMIFIIAVWVSPNAFLLLLSIIWILSSILLTVFVEDSGNGKRNYTN
ncbi:hypothetical protein OXIME_001483 [Oxyplasma meridianum]|uniref:DUF3096 domain-containing protein n=1 Tax=Oxyplasma meridianum TaxID=3073602 RepID=A0AAX4NHB3_9ARCH